MAIMRGQTSTAPCNYSAKVAFMWPQVFSSTDVPGRACEAQSMSGSNRTQIKVAEEIGVVTAIGVAAQGPVAIVSTTSVRIEDREVETKDFTFCENMLDAIRHVGPAQIVPRGICILGIEVAGLPRVVGAGEGCVAKRWQGMLIGLVPSVASVRTQTVPLGLLAVQNVFFFLGQGLVSPGVKLTTAVVAVNLDLQEIAGIAVQPLPLAFSQL